MKSGYMENVNNFEIREKVDNLYEKLVYSAATFIFKPNEIKQIKEQIFNLQEQCNHKFENGKCIYCRKEE